jgi:hypothetical protein
MQDLYQKFLKSKDTLQIFRGDMLISSSTEKGLLGFMKFVSGYNIGKPVVIFDRVMGNAAALLAVKVKCQEVYSPLGSEQAVKTLKNFNVVYHIDKVVPFICRDDSKGMCPMEELSTGKTPGEFFNALEARIAAGNLTA